MFEQDYIKRQLRAAVEGIARTLKLLKEQRYDDAEGDLDAALDELLTIDREVFETLDAASLLPLLGQPARVEAIAQVLTAQAVVCDAQQLGQRAQRLRRRALVFFEHAATNGMECSAAMQQIREELNS